MNGNAPVKKILILAANPKGTSRLRLDEEVREIEAGLQRAQKRDQFILEQKWAVRPRDIRRALLDINPQIVHFSGHGAGEEGLLFEDETGRAKLVDGEALAGLFELFAEQVECVVLNGCYSQVQAEEIAQHISYVIGMSQTIGDKAAIEFAVGFYDALGAGRTVEFAHKLGCNAIRMAGIVENLKPVLIQKHKLIGKDAPSSTEAATQSVKPELTSDSENQAEGESSVILQKKTNKHRSAAENFRRAIEGIIAEDYKISREIDEKVTRETIQIIQKDHPTISEEESKLIENEIIEHYKSIDENLKKYKELWYKFTKNLDNAQKNHIKNQIRSRQKALCMNDETASIICSNVGEDLSNKKEGEKAAFFFQEALNLDPLNVEAYIGLGKIFCEKKMFKNAIEHFKIAQKLLQNNEKEDQALDLQQIILKLQSI